MELLYPLDNNGDCSPEGSKWKYVHKQQRYYIDKKGIRRRDKRYGKRRKQPYYGPKKKNPTYTFQEVYKKEERIEEFSIKLKKYGTFKNACKFIKSSPSGKNISQMGFRTYLRNHGLKISVERPYPVIMEEGGKILDPNNPYNKATGELNFIDDPANI